MEMVMDFEEENFLFHEYFWHSKNLRMFLTMFLFFGGFWIPIPGLFEKIFRDLIWKVNF